MLTQLWRFVAGATWIVLLLVGAASGGVIGGLAGLVMGLVSFEFSTSEVLLSACTQGSLVGGVLGALIGMAYATRIWIKSLSPDLAAR